jgi:type I restriction enzyme S subunit
MKKYTKYKPSGNEWIGEIPEHWEIKRIKYLRSKEKYSLVDGPFGSNLKSEHFIDNGDVYVIESGFITSGEFKYIREFKTITSDHYETIKRSECYENCIIISKIGENYGMSGILPKLDRKSVISGNSISLTLNENQIVKFIHHVLVQHKNNGTFKKEVQQTGQPFISLGVIDNMIIPTPPISEQHQIVRFLDEKTEIIDKLISTKVRKIELLKLQRTSLINQVITKGLDPNVKMKDSGVEWIGEIPDHWEMRRVSNFGVFFKGNGIRKDEVKEEGIPCIRYGEIYTKYDRVVYEPVSFIDEETSKNSVIIRKGDVLFTGSGETVEDIGKTIVYYGESDIFIGGDIIVLRLNEGIYPLFISYLMNTKFVQYQKSLSGRGEIIVHIYSKNIKEIITPLPPQNEQKQIVEFLDTRTKEIDDLISLEQRKIDVLKDYRKSLISEVITGKIDVRTNLN